MAKKPSLDELLDEILALPEAAQAELIEALIDMCAQRLGIYQLDDDDRAALARSAEDVRLGRFAPDADIEETFSRYKA